MGIFCRHRLWGLLLPLLAAACIADDEETGGADLRAGDPLPSLNLQLNDGSRLTDATLAGRPSLIVFFHTGCSDCRQALPIIQRIHDEAGAALAVVGIGREEPAEEVAAYWLSEGFTLPYSAQEDRSAYQLFARSGIPRIYLAGPDRIIRRVFTDRPAATYDALLKALETIRNE